MNRGRAGVQVVEPVWGSKEYIKYLVLVNTASGVSTFFVIYLAYAMDRNNEGNLLCAPSFQDFPCRLPSQSDVHLVVQADYL